MGNDTDSRAQTGRRGRQSRSTRETSRSAGGLRLFSLKVVEKIRSRVRTTYNAVANELVSDQNLSGGNARDGKSIRRRCYDAINVLLACGLIRKDDRKQIVWRGHGNVELDRLRAEVSRKKEEVEQKKKLLQDIERKHKTLEALLDLGASRQSGGQDGGSGSGGSSSARSSKGCQGGQRYTIPFMLVRAAAGSGVQLQASDDKTTVQFEMTDAPPDLHDDCSVVMRLQQYEAERQANQQCFKQRRGLGPVHGTDSGQPTPAQQAAIAAAAANPMAVDFLTPQALGQQPPPQLPLPLPAQQQQGEQQPQTLPQHLHPPHPPHHHQPPTYQQLPAVAMRAEELETQEQLPPALPSPPRLPLPSFALLASRAVADRLVSHPMLRNAKARSPGSGAQDQGASQSEPRPEADFLAHLKPVATNRTRLYSRMKPPVLPPLGSQAQAHALAQAPEAQPAADAAGTKSYVVEKAPWEQLAATVAQPPSLPPPPQAQALGFSPGGAFSHLLCARSLEQQLQPQLQPQPGTGCQPLSARDCFHQHFSIDPLYVDRDPLHAPLGVVVGGEGSALLHQQPEQGEPHHLVTALGAPGAHPLKQQPLKQQPLKQQPPQHHQQQHHHQSQLEQQQHQRQQQQQPNEQQPMTLVQVPPGAAAGTSLYSFEETLGGGSHLPPPLPASLFGSGSDPDPFGLGIGSSILAADQLGYMGWPFSLSPDPFSPSAFLVTPSFNSKGQCRSEANRQVGPLHIGVQQ